MSEILATGKSFNIAGLLWFDDKTNQMRILEPTEPWVNEPERYALQEFVLPGELPSDDEVRACLMVAAGPSPAWHILKGGSREVELPAGGEACTMKIWRANGAFERHMMKAEGNASHPALYVDEGDTFQFTPLDGESGQVAVLTYFREPFHIENEERLKEPPADPSVFWGTGR